MEKCKIEDSNVSNPGSCHNNDHTKGYKPIKRQYFTFGKDNCLVHHPTTQNKKSSPSAIFYKVNPFNTQSEANKTFHKKVKSTFQAPKKQEKFSSQTCAIKKEAISKISRNLKQPQASSVSNSDFRSIVVRGTSLKLEPKKHFEISTCCATSYCPNIKRCKMCGDIMMNIESIPSFNKNSSSGGSCSGCLNKKSSHIVNKEKVENTSHQHNPIIKRCIMCSKLFKQPSSSIACEKCPSLVNTKDHEKGPVLTTKDKVFSSKANTERKAKTSMPSRLKEDYEDTFTKCKASQSDKCNKLPSKSKGTTEELLQVRGLSSKQQLETKANVSAKNISTEKPMQTKLSTESNQLTAKAKSTVEKATLKDCAFHEQCKNTNVASAKAKASTMPSYIKSLKSNLASKCKKVAVETNPEISIGTEHCQHSNTTNKNSSIEKSNQTKSLPERSQLTASKNDAGELPLKSYLGAERRKNTNMDCEVAVADKLSRSVQTNSLYETNLDITTSDHSSESFTSEGYLNGEQNRDSNMDQGNDSAEESNIAVQTDSLFETSQQKSKRDTENYLERQIKNIHQTNNEDSSGTLIHTKSLQLSQDFLSKISADLVLHRNKDINDKDENISPTPVIHNVTVNNYYYLTGCDLKERCTNQPVSCTDHSFSTTTQSSSGSISISSDMEDSLEIDKIEYKQNKSNFDYPACCEYLKNPSIQLKFPQSVSKELGVVFKHNPGDFLSNVFQPQSDKISFLKEAHSTFENDPCPTVGRIGDLSSNINHFGRQEILFKNLSLCAEKKFQNYDQDAQSLYGIKTVNPFIQKSVMIFEEMDNVRNEPIDPAKILQELKQNPHLMKSINQMAAKKLNFPRKATVFKDLKFK